MCDAISKILAIMLNDRLEVWSNENKIVKVEQIGFKKLSRPSDHLFVLRSLVVHTKMKEKNFMHALWTSERLLTLSGGPDYYTNLSSIK